MARSSIKVRRRKVLLALLRQVRLEVGLRQADVAAQLRKPQSFVSRYESEERLLNLPELRYVCRAIGVSLQEFVQRFEDLLAQNED